MVSEPNIRVLPLHCVKQKLDPQPVPAEEQRVPPPVPDGKDPVDLLGHLHAVLHVSAGDHRGITGGLKAIPAAEPVLFQLLRIVNLPVVDDPELLSPLTVHHGLNAAA